MRETLETIIFIIYVQPKNKIILFLPCYRLARYIILYYLTGSYYMYHMNVCNVHTCTYEMRLFPLSYRY